MRTIRKKTVFPKRQYSSGSVSLIPIFITSCLLLLLSMLFSPALAYALESSDIGLPNERNTLGRNVPNVRLFDSKGKQFTLKDIMDGKPLVISPIYTRCTTACFTITDSLREVVAKTEGLGKDFKALSLSFDARDKPEDLEKFRKQWAFDGVNWIAAAGEEGEIKKLLDSIDFHYKFDTATGEFLHSNLVVVLTPDLRISRYLHGVLPKERDLRLSVMEAKKGTSRLSSFDGFWLKCFKFDSATGTYKTDWIFLGEIFMAGMTIGGTFIIFFGKDLYAFIFRRKKPL